MRRIISGSIVAVAVAALGVGLAPPSSTAPSPAAAPEGDRPLDAYTASEVTGEELASLASQGYDLHEAHPTGDTSEVSLVLSGDEAGRLREQGIEVRLARVKGGQTVRQFAAAEAAAGFTVWKSYDEPGGYRDQLVAAAKKYAGVSKLVKLGTTYQGRDILALKVTQGARGRKDGSRPAVIFSATQHAREWIAPEVTRRLMYSYLDRWRADDPGVKKLLKGTELWFVPVLNPDGYQYTFDQERLWRKNLRDNNGDGITQVGDGVDPNRNFPTRWGYDNEGSSPIASSETYRGPSPGSEPETQATMRLFQTAKAEFMINYHSNGRWLLYNDGWQTGTPTADDPIFHALSGNLDEPAIKDYHPGLSSDVLYVTNGEMNGHAQQTAGTLGWTPELSPGCPGCGFVFPDDEQLVQEEFERNLPFAESVAESATDPDDPKSSLGIKTKPFYLESEDAYKSGIPSVQLSFTTSYGDPQPVAVLAKRSLGAVKARWKINGGATKSATTSEWTGGEKFGMTSTHYHQVRGVVTGTKPGDSVEVWFEGGGERSPSFTYRAVSETGNKVLVVAAEDYTGASPVQTPGPHYLDYYLDALAANGESADVYDVDAQGRTAPDALGVLSHYDAAVWYTGDDAVTRTAGRGAGNVDRLALDEMYEFRAFMNEGGKVMYTGDLAGAQYSGATVGTQRYDPQGEIACPTVQPAGIDQRRCLPLRGSGDGTNDVLQYWFGGYLQIPGDGHDDEGNVYDAAGIDDPFTGIDWAMNGPESADNQDATSSFISTSGILPVAQFPQFASWPAARWDKPGGPFDPHTGEQFVYSQIADVTYKRLTRTVTVPAGGGALDFWTSYDTEGDWDYVFVEARTPGSDNWTTLPDANGHTTQATGDSCAAGWRELHPQLDRYQTYDAATGACTPSGSTGAWHAASGNSGGWQEWNVDLGAWQGASVEVSITYASDWGTQNLGTFIDDVTLPDGTSTSFETGLEGWTVSGAPPGSAVNGNDWIVTPASGFPVGAAIATPNSLMLGVGFEGIATPAERNAVMGRALEHLLE